jgi:hypothetical protein
MAAYAVLARIGRVDPHLTVRDVAERDDPAPADGLPDVVPVDVVDSVWDDRFSERLASFSERWAQATFYLFDPESWRS